MPPERCCLPWLRPLHRRLHLAVSPPPGPSENGAPVGVRSLNIGERAHRVPRSRSPNDPRQRVQIPDDEVPDELDEELDMGEE